MRNRSESSRVSRWNLVGSIGSIALRRNKSTWPVAGDRCETRPDPGREYETYERSEMSAGDSWREVNFMDS